MLRFPPGLHLASVSINPGRNQQTQQASTSQCCQPRRAQQSWEGAALKDLGAQQSHRIRKHTGHHEGQEQQRDTFQPPPGYRQSSATTRFLNSFIALHPCFPWEREKHKIL